MKPTHTFSTSRAGFTLSEILLAMLVFAIAISTILALLARSIEAVDEIVLKDEAMRLSSALEQKMQSLPFDDVFNLFVGGQTQVLNAVHARTGPDRTSAYPVVAPGASMGQDYFVLPVIAQTLDPLFLQAREGRLFAVQLRVSPTNPMGENLAGTPDAYASAAIVLYAEFFPVGVPGQVLTNLTPVYAYNFVVRR